MAKKIEKSKSAKNKKPIVKPKSSPSKKTVKANNKKKVQKLPKKNMIFFILALVFFLALVVGTTYAYFNVTSNTDTTNSRLLTRVPEAGSVSLINPSKNLHIRLNAVNMQEKDTLKELWTTDTEDDYDEEEIPREVSKLELIGGNDDSQYSCTFKLNIELLGTMVESLKLGDGVIRFSGLETVEYDLTEVISPKIITVSSLNINNREEKLYVSAKINNKKQNQDYLQGKSLEINITNSDLSCVIGSMSNNYITVAFDAKGGQVSPKSKIIAKGDYYNELPTPTKEGYTFMGWKANVLPSEYQEVLYIESDGYEYIDTGLKGTQNSSFDIHFVITSMINGRGIFGHYGGTNDGSFYIYTSGSSNLQYGYYRFANVGNSLKSNVDYHIVSNGNTVSINGTNYSNSYSGDFTTAKTLRLFNITGGNYTGLPIKLYSFKLYESNELVRNFIPCYRKNDKVIGLYDTVEGRFYTNEGTGSFSKGEDIDDSSYSNMITSSTKVVTNKDHIIYAVWQHNPQVTLNPSGGSLPKTKGWANGQTSSELTKRFQNGSTYGNLPSPTKTGYTFKGWKYSVIPNEYQEVSYIESDGYEYIDTGLKGTQNSSFDIHFMITSMVNGRGIFGHYAGENGGCFYLYTSGNGNLQYGYNGHSNVGSALQANVDYQISSSGNKVTINGNEYSNLSSGNFITAQNLILFNITGGTYTGLPMRLYSFKLYDNNVLVRNFVPCYRRADNAIGLYDTVDGKFYTNEGTGSFSKGSDVNSSNYSTVITSMTQMVTNEDHTLYAMWE